MVVVVAGQRLGWWVEGLVCSRSGRAEVRLVAVSSVPTE